MLPLKALLRLYRSHPWLLLMSLAGLVLGVSLVVAIELLNHSARTNFVAARSQLAGEANYRLAPAGGLDEQLYVQLVTSQPALDAMPQLHGWLKDEEGRSFQLLGMDLFNPGPLRQLFGAQPASEPAFSLNRSDSIWLSAPEAERLGWQAGQSRRFVLGGSDGARTLTLTLAGTFEPGAVPMERLLITDIGLAQPLLGKAGRLDRIVFKLSDAEARTLQATLQTDYPIQPLWLEPISPALDASQLGDALALNLTALSLLAMAVGLFLVFNAQRFVQSVRRPQLAQLIILGMGPSRVLRWLILELLILATLGTLLGVLLGSLLALALMGQLTQALADLYGPNPIDLLRLSPVSLLKALLIGLLGTLAANLPGWWQLLRQSPLELRAGSSRPPRSPVATARAVHRHLAAVRPMPVAAANGSDRRPLYRRRLAAGHGTLATRCPARPAWLAATARGRPPHRPSRGSRDPLSPRSHRHRGDGVAAGHRGGYRHRGHGVEFSLQRGDLARPASGRRSLCHRPQGGGGQQGHLERYNPRDPARQSAGERRLAPLGAPRPLAGAAHRVGADGLYPPA